MNITVENVSVADYPQIKDIFQQGIETGLATFETEVPSWEAWDRRFWKKCRVIARDDHKIVGWGALSDVSKRKVYSGVKEDTLYVSKTYRGKGVGGLILNKLITESEKLGVWTLQAVMFPENIASVKLHSLMGFREVGIRKSIGQLNRVWRDTLLMERRSRIGLEHLRR